MKKVFRVLLVLLVIVAGLALIGAAYINFRSMPSYTPDKKDIKVEVTQARIDQGTKLASMLCRSCHYNDQTQKFTGRQLTEATQFGEIYSKNITHDPVAGIGSWTDGELIYFIRTGVNKSGKYIPPYMPKLIHISDEDLYSIIAFLRSDNKWVAADKTVQPPAKPSFLTKFLLTIGAFKPFSYPAEKIEGPDTTDKVKWGRYITLYQFECFACHSKDFAKNDYFNPEASQGYFGGGNEMFTMEGKPINSLNITQDQETGIGKWTEDDFVKALRFGQLSNNQPGLRYPMIPYSNLTDDEAKAVFAFLKTVPPLQHKVERKF
jgi:cytochrome c2